MDTGEPGPGVVGEEALSLVAEANCQEMNKMGAGVHTLRLLTRWMARVERLSGGDSRCEPGF